MNGKPESADTASDGANALNLLLNRHSVGPRHLVEPGPDADQILHATAAAMRAPDNQALRPFRFVLIPRKYREALGELFAACARRSGISAEDVATERERALRGPVLLAFVACIDAAHERVPPHEQWLAAGGALSNFMTALHFMGFGAKVLSGRKAADAEISRAFCAEGEILVGWIAAGTPSKTPHPRESDFPDSVFRVWEPDGVRKAGLAPNTQ